MPAPTAGLTPVLGGLVPPKVGLLGLRGRGSGIAKLLGGSWVTLRLQSSSPVEDLWCHSPPPRPGCGVGEMWDRSLFSFSYSPHTLLPSYPIIPISCTWYFPMIFYLSLTLADSGGPPAGWGPAPTTEFFEQSQSVDLPPSCGTVTRRTGTVHTSNLYTECIVIIYIYIYIYIVLGIGFFGPRTFLGIRTSSGV